MSTLVLLLWPALGEIHLAITFVLRCICRAWEWWEGEGQLGAWFLKLQPSLFSTLQSLIPSHTRLPSTTGLWNTLLSSRDILPTYSNPSIEPESPGTCLLARTVTFSFSIFTWEDSTASAPNSETLQS